MNINVLLVTSFAQKKLANAFKYSLDSNYQIPDDDKDTYQPVVVYKCLMPSENQELEFSVSMNRCIKVFNTEPYHDEYIEDISYGFRSIIFLYDSSEISKEDFDMTVDHLKRHIDIYYPDKITAVDFNMNVSDYKLPKQINIIITKFKRDANFADKLLNKIINMDEAEKSITTELPSTSV